MQPSSPALTEGTLHSLLRQYDGVGEPLSCTPVSHGLLNRGYRLTTTRGGYFLKHHLDGPGSLGRIERQHRATDRLGELGLPVVPVVPGSGGGTATVAEGRCFALHPWIEGTHRHGSELTAGQSRQLGALLGRVHVRLARALPEAPSTGHESADPAATYDMIGALLERVRSRRNRDSFDELAEHRLTERRELLRQHADARPGAVPDRFTGWVHGDFHPLNLLYAPPGRTPRPVAILDWDRLGVHPRAEEAVRGAAIFFLRPGGTLDLRKVRAFARAYRGAAGASRAELAAAVHRVWWERLNDFWMLRWRYQLCDVRTDPQFPAAAALVVWWTRHYPAVQTAFCD
ncbi:phosphotransferase enzyme family protein [Streptomyces qinglanensis]|uniref:Ser/Thr protein kinase RdoA involved in Cpx stress response, MazF antagonist n=1 Tax=Streptomyces qinglanensis TaxID=943816 RepID=A0A1H9PVM3_9ACTN|nr:phosphotransferase [Streptomyces qinglanensis]SER51875.1 Ser/Thr protein kinase RdoA involved in Cpx stress response, MazF antagonist [Streptomyces qinglanensis]